MKLLKRHGNPGVNQPTQNANSVGKLAGTAPIVKQTIALLSIVIAFGLAMTVAAQQNTGSEVTPSTLKQQLLDLESKETQLRMRLEELNEQLKPESIERELAGIGSVHPEELREHRRKLLTIERSGLQKQLDLLEERRAQIEAAIAATETAAYQPAPMPSPMSEMATMIKESLIEVMMLPLVAAGMILLINAAIKRIRPRHNLLLALLFLLFILPASAQSQETESMKSFAKGHGSIVSAVEERKVCAALVVLRRNGEAVITLYSDLQLQVQGTWSVSDSSPQEIQLKITGLELGGNASGSGKVLLSDDRKYIRELTITGKLLNGPEVTVRFIADRSDDSQPDMNPILVSTASVAAKSAVSVRSATIPLVIY